MSPVIFSCVLCGYFIWDFEDPRSESWLKQFRARECLLIPVIKDAPPSRVEGSPLTSTVHSSPKGTWISGVGLYNDPRAGIWIVPSDYAVRWNDSAYHFSARDELAVMQQRPANGRHGFVFHEACWSLLQHFCHPEAVPLGRVLEICKSLPFPLRGTGVSWGHDYGGLDFLDKENHYPWEDQLVKRDEDSIICQLARENPYDVPEIQQLLKEPPQIPPCVKELGSSGPILERGDCFVGLAWEIREGIAVYLPTADVLSLRRASRAFVPIFSSQHFWASRFEANADRGFLFEMRNSKELRDWRSLYRRTNNAHSHPGLPNRKRIWTLIQSLTDLLSMRCYSPPETSRWDLIRAGLRWREVAGDVKQEKSGGNYRNFSEGCRLFNKQCTSIPNLLSQIAVSIIRIGDATYIAGVRLIPSKGTDICLGYRAEGKELFQDVAVLKGFVLAVGSRGIQALQIIASEGDLSQWFGTPDELPKTKRLAILGSVAALEAGFDGYKMVSLGVAEKLPSLVEISMGKNESLRNTALWYPKIPQPALYLNDHLFADEDHCSLGYQPLCWTLFGGPGGIYLRSLTEISVTRVRSLCGIEFHYNTDDIPLEWRKLGRRKSTEFEKVMNFPIDGPGGEIIETVEVSLVKYGESAYSFYKHGKLRSFKASQRLLEQRFEFAKILPTDVFITFIEYYRSSQIGGILFTLNPNEIRQMSFR